MLGGEVGQEPGRGRGTKQVCLLDRPETAPTREDPVLCPICYVIQRCCDQVRRQGKNSGWWWPLSPMTLHGSPRILESMRRAGAPRWPTAGTDVEPLRAPGTGAPSDDRSPRTPWGGAELPLRDTSGSALASRNSKLGEGDG